MKSKETLVAALERSVSRHALSPLFGEREGDSWKWMSYRDFSRRVDAARAGLALAGVGRDDRVALLSNNRVAWAIAAYACYGLEAAVVPMYPAQGARVWRHILRDSGAKVLICATKSLYERCGPITDTLAAPPLRLCFELGPHEAGSFARLENEGRQEPLPASDPAPEALATILYTSGTGGEPKGVMLSHRNITSNVAAILRALPLSHRDRSLSFLPWAHAFGQTCELHAMIRLGASMALSSSIERLGDELAEISPTVLVSVPAIFTRIYERVEREIALRPGIIRELFERGMALGQKRRRARLGIAERLAFEAADRAVLSVVRARLGGRLRYAFSGGAPLSIEVGDFIDQLGITVYQGYGLTEASPVVSLERPSACRRGSVGKAVDGVALEVAGTADAPGEIVVHGPGVMQGYWGRPDETARVIRSDGALATGDLGYLDEDGFLFITGRSDEQYKLASGKDVSPAALEERMKLSEYIKNAMVFGEGRDRNVALVVVDLDALARWADARDLRFASTAAMLESPRVRAHILAEIGERTHEVRHYERIQEIALVAQDFTTENGMLTATQKIRRHAVIERFGEVLRGLYEAPER